MRVTGIAKTGVEATNRRPIMIGNPTRHVIGIADIVGSHVGHGTVSARWPGKPKNAGKEESISKHAAAGRRNRVGGGF